ncbi:unnamed protein product [Caenorhabditis bovis]|uniref:Uncharacterized protein n=1 Tax=Caenorhabditis bovis TaxID=2654633 RepID=A0A8S1E9Y5_9PELO|nr:unnamed protein product [Caenorhabditis bovis]
MLTGKFIIFYGIRNLSTKPQTFIKNIKFPTIDNKIVTLDAVYEDNLPGGSSVGTIVALHGAFGSHHDFQQIRYPNQKLLNEERQSYTNALLDELNIPGNVVYLGHSRGAENALITAVERPKACVGLVVLNSVGLREAKCQKMCNSVSRIYWSLPEWIGDYLLHKGFKMSGYKYLKDGKSAIISIDAVLSVGMTDNLPYIAKINETNIKICAMYSGNDHLIEKEIGSEILDHYKNLEKFDFESEIDENSIDAILKAIIIKKDGHYQNKTRADLIAKILQSILFNFMIRRRDALLRKRNSSKICDVSCARPDVDSSQFKVTEFYFKYS